MYSNPNQQMGLVLMLMLLILLSLSAYTLLQVTPQYANTFSQQEKSLIALRQAKAALLGYAIDYPRDHADKGPGHLPCPDINNNGVASGACALQPNASTIGRIPWKTLDIQHLRDSHGETLWYAVADDFRSNESIGPNSEAVGNFSVDNHDDIVAIIFAPGVPLRHQERMIAPLDVEHYLEGDNSDGDVFFTTDSAVNEVNDLLMPITRRELMRVIERRVLGDIAQSLIRYQKQYHAFPWLSPLIDIDAVYHGRLGTTKGRLPYHRSTTQSATEDLLFMTDLEISWSGLDSGQTTSSGTVSEDCLINLRCNDGFPVVVDKLLSQTRVACIWRGRDTVDCPSFSIVREHDAYQGPHCPSGGTLRRRYEFNLPTFTGSATISPPSTNKLRTRQVLVTASQDESLPQRSSAWLIRDEVSCPPQSEFREIGRGSMSFDNNVVDGTITVGKIQYDLDLDIEAPELPVWFVANGWHKLIYVFYADGESLPGDDADIMPQDGQADHACRPQIDCIELDTDGRKQHDIRALAISAGAPLRGTSRPSNDLGDYLELNNAQLDTSFQKRRYSSSYNDQIRIISTINP